MRSVQQHQFARVPQANIQRSAFNRSFTHKTTFDSGYLIPVYLDEALPGDTFVLDATMFARMATPLFPIMDNLYMDAFFFFVPNRLIWTNFVKMMGEQIDPGDSTDYTVPVVASPVSTGWVVGELWDYFGIPTGVQNLEVSALFSRAYNLIYNEWFRDENLIDSVVVDKDDGPDNEADYVLLKACKRHDYFTSCLPWAQKDPDSIISLPLGDSAPVTGLGLATQSYTSGGIIYQTDGSGMIYPASYQNIGGNYAANTFRVVEDPNNAGFPNIRVDLTQATASTVNDLRQAVQLQRMLERDARSGSRYTEVVRAHFGVVSPDARLQRPEYLGGSSAPVRITPVPQTSQSDTTPQGTMTGFGTITCRAGFTKSFTEHGVLLGIVRVRADLTYQQGLNRMFSRQTRYDFYWPDLANLGEQEVLMKEIYTVDPATDTDSDGTPDNDEAFGYQERYAEYRYKPSMITGQFRSTYAQSLDAWHLSQEFGSAPSLSQTFIEENPPVSRVVADADDPEFIFDSFFSIKSVRPMPMYSVPGLGGRF